MPLIANSWYCIFVLLINIYTILLQHFHHCLHFSYDQRIFTISFPKLCFWQFEYFSIKASLSLFLVLNVTVQKRHEKAYQESEHTKEAWDKIVESEANQLLLEAIKSLPPQSRRIMELTYDGKSLKETAELLEISINTVKAIKSKALQKLRDFFSQENL